MGSVIFVAGVTMAVLVLWVNIISLRFGKTWKEGFAPYVLPSGRYSTVLGHFAGVQDLAEQYGGNYETEWEFLRTVLQKNGVPEKAILREDKATYTYENALRSREVTDAAGIEVKKAILCCRNLHARRCILYYQLVYPRSEEHTSELQSP